MSGLLVPAVLLLIFMSPAVGQAGQVQLDPAFSIALPDGWKTAGNDAVTITPPDISAVLDCFSGNVSDIRAVGWKHAPQGGVEGAFCITYRKVSMAKGLALLQSSNKAEREQAAAALADGLVSAVYGGYAKKKIKVTALYADAIAAGKEAVVVMDGTISGPAGPFVRVGTVFIKRDALLDVAFVHSPSASGDVVRQLDAMPVSVKWNQ